MLRHYDHLSLLTPARAKRAQILAAQIDADQRRLRQVQASLRLLGKGNTMSAFTFDEKPLQPLRLVQLSAQVNDPAEIGATIGPLFERVNAAVDATALARTGPSMAHYTATDTGTVVAAAEQISDADAPTGTEVAELPALPRAVTTTYTAADIDGIHVAWQALVQEALRRGLTPHGTCREVYYETPMDPGGSRWVVELQQPVS